LKYIVVILHDILYILILIRRKITIFARLSSSLQKIKSIFFNFFRKCYTDSFKTLLDCKISIETLHNSEFQIIFLIRDLLELSGGLVDCEQHAFDQEYTINDNFSIYIILIDVIDTNQFGDFDPKEM